MTGPTIACPKCRTDILLTPSMVREAKVNCPSCLNARQFTAFPALLKGDEGPARSASVFEGDASCYYDPDQRAVAVCDDCGRFISEFHRVALNAEHTTCLTCLSEGRSEKSKELTKREQTVYDNLALLLAIVPPISLIGLYFIPFTAPSALYVVLRYWKKGPNSVVPRGRTRFVIAGIIAVIEIALVAFVIFNLVNAFRS